MELTLPTCDVLGVQCVVGDVGSAADVVIERAVSGAGGYGVLCNVHVLMMARRRPDVMEAVSRAWAVFPDGAPVAWFQRRVGMSGAERIGGPDLMPAVFDRGQSEGVRHALVGSTPAVLAALAENLGRRFPRARIVATHAPPPGQEHDPDLLGKVASAKPHLVWLALGAPKQELWMRSTADQLAPALVLGVGAAFDFQAGARERAPDWARRSGFEWAYRLAAEPRRLFGRYATTNTAFVLAAARQLARRRMAA